MSISWCKVSTFTVIGTLVSGITAMMVDAGGGPSLQEAVTGHRDSTAASLGLGFAIFPVILMAVVATARLTSCCKETEELETNELESVEIEAVEGQKQQGAHLTASAA